MKRVFEGQLTLDHMATHVPHRFPVPEGVGTMQVEFSYSPHQPGVGKIANQLSISVYGPDGARGTRHNNADQSPVISAKWASPGYLPAPIEAGEWVVEIDVHRILPPGNVTYRIDIVCETEERDAPPVEPMPDFPRQKKRRGPGWYTGDLHGHTFHSDGDLSPAEYLMLAHQREYDFVALTDHNTFSAVPQIKRMAGEAITLIGGVELTTFNGHALALGLEGWTEWRVKEGATMSDIAKSLQEAGSLYVIAHPESEGHPYCTGCRWAYSDMLPGPARHVEIWSRMWTERSSHNEGAVHLFYQWLNSGYRMVATAGTDTHHHIPVKDRIAANRVYAQDNTQKEILSALRRGHSYVTSGPDMALSAESAHGSQAGIGDVVSDGHLRIVSGWQAGKIGSDLTELDACLIRQGQEVERWPCSEGNETAVKTQAEPGCWFILELRDRKGGLHGLTNPIFVGQEGEHWR